MTKKEPRRKRMLLNSPTIYVYKAEIFARKSNNLIEADHPCKTVFAFTVIKILCSQKKTTGKI